MQPMILAALAAEHESDLVRDVERRRLATLAACVDGCARGLSRVRRAARSVALLRRRTAAALHPSGQACCA